MKLAKRSPGLAKLGILSLSTALLTPLAHAQETTHLLIVVGLGGEPASADAFHQWAASLRTAAEKKLAIPRAQIAYLGEKQERDASQIDGRSTRENLAAELHKIAARARPGETVALILIGHGSAAAGEARFNLPGPDVSGGELAKLLDPLALQKLVVVNAFSSSGDFLKPLSGKNRVIIAATKSGIEKNESVFGKFWSEAIAGDVADVDKDGRTSIAEAFDYAKQQVASSYEKDNRLLTEHAMLEDGQAGALARTTFLGGVPRAAETPSGDPRVAQLEKERRALEDRVLALRAQKDALAADAYEKELERLLLELALKGEAIRAARGGK